MLEDIDVIRHKSGLEPLSEVSRRNFLKKAGAAGAAAMVPGVASAASDHTNHMRTIDEAMRLISMMDSSESKRVLAALQELKSELEKETRWSNI